MRVVGRVVNVLAGEMRSLEAVLKDDRAITVRWSRMMVRLERVVKFEDDRYIYLYVDLLVRCLSTE